jgi:hypothetical protein
VDGFVRRRGYDQLVVKKLGKTENPFMKPNQATNPPLLRKESSSGYFRGPGGTRKKTALELVLRGRFSFGLNPSRLIRPTFREYVGPHEQVVESNHYERTSVRPCVKGVTDVWRKPIHSFEIECCISFWVKYKSHGTSFFWTLLLHERIPCRHCAIHNVLEILARCAISRLNG